jgi:hypothetical protein
MKIKPPANKNERHALKQRLEREHGARVDIIRGRFGWYARFLLCDSLRPLRLCVTSGPSHLGLRASGFGFQTTALGGGVRLRPVARGRRARAETAQDLLALAGKVGFEFGTAAQNGWGTGMAREW